ncbi:XRE family transcriptional regulator [Streptosporangium sandarakinum]|uniref:XRE family transcriptional regulator n=1 Tax=Streptosporangium sandarakinum TaxID=1260955 RepID=UPI0033BDBBD2
MPQKAPNALLRAWRNTNRLTRVEMAERINTTATGIAERLACDEERIRRWETGEVRWPSTPYRLALTQLTGLSPDELGFIRSQRDEAVGAARRSASLIRDASPEIDEIADIAAWLNRGSRHADVVEEIERAAASMADAHTEVPPRNLLRHVRRVHRQVRDLLSRGDLGFRQMRDLLRIDADLIAHAAVLLGDIDRDQAAEAYGRLAVRLAEEAGSNPGLAWYARAKTARWQGRYVEAADLARRGYDATPAGAMKQQLAWYEANSAALFGNAGRAREAAHRAGMYIDSATADGSARSVWSFPSHRRTLFSLAVAVRTGDPDGALRTVAYADRTTAAGDRPALANWAQIRVTAGIAHLLKDDLSGAIHETTPVLSVPPELRLTTVTGYLEDLSHRLARSRFADSADALRLRQQIRDFKAAALPDEPTMESP